MIVAPLTLPVFHASPTAENYAKAVFSSRLIIFLAKVGNPDGGKTPGFNQWGVIPLLVIDVWEDAYYLDYQNCRGDFIQA